MQDAVRTQPIQPLLLAPGPVPLHPKVREILASPMIHHRTPEFDQVFLRTKANLKLVFQTQQEVFLLTSTGSGGMEALLINVMHPGDQVVGIDSGKFGERWCDMVTEFGGVLHRLKVPWGQALELNTFREYLQQHPHTKIVLCQATETSTGQKHPLQAMAQVIHEFPDVLFLVDGITGLGAYPIPMDEWGIDGLVGGSQKAFMLPTGMSFVSFSAAAWRRIKNNPTPRFYFDIRREQQANAKGETLFSSNVPLIRALDFVLSELVLKPGLAAHFATIAERARLTREFIHFLGLQVCAANPSESITAFFTPAGVDSAQLRNQLEQQDSITVMGGQDQWKGKVLRVGHMGYIEVADLARCFSRLHHRLSSLDIAHAWPTLGEGTDWIQKNVTAKV